MACPGPSPSSPLQGWRPLPWLRWPEVSIALHASWGSLRYIMNSCFTTHALQARRVEAAQQHPQRAIHHKARPPDQDNRGEDHRHIEIVAGFEDDVADAAIGGDHFGGH